MGNLYYRVFSNVIGDLPTLKKSFLDMLADFKGDFARLVHPDEMADYNMMIESMEGEVR